MGVETSHDSVQESLFGGFERRFVFGSEDKFLSEVRGIAEGGHVGTFAKKRRIGLEIARVRDIRLQPAYLGNIVVEVTEGFSAFHHSCFRMCTDHFLNMRFVFDFSHILIKFKYY